MPAIAPSLNASLPNFRGYELEAYVDYWRLLLDLSSADPATVKAFLARHEKSYIAEKLRADWLKLQGRKQQWAEFDAEYPALAQPDQDLSCLSLQSRRASGDTRVYDEAMPLWLTLIEPPESCYPVLEGLIIEKRVLADQVWARIRRQFEANKLAAARYTMNYLPASQTPDAKLAQAVSGLAAAVAAQAAAGAGRQPHEPRTGGAGDQPRRAQRPRARPPTCSGPHRKPAAARRKRLGVEPDRLAGGDSAYARCAGLVSPGR